MAQQKGGLYFIYDEKKAREIIDGMKQRASDAGPLFKPIALWLQNAITKIFKDSGGVFGIPSWPPISSTIYGKERRGTGGPTKVVYNAASKPLISTAGFRNSFGVRDINETTQGGYLTFGSALPDAEVYQYGGWNASGYSHTKNVPKRKVLPSLEAEDVKQKLNDFYRSFLAYIIKGNKT